MKCVDPCPGLCGHNARCDVMHHQAECNCIAGYRGNPYQSCSKIPEVYHEPTDPCQPSPCGSNAQCRNKNGAAVCSCLPNFFGSPPNCRPECVVDSECDFSKNCVNMRCKDPCPGTCGVNARCQVVNHSPICSCNVGFTGDPFVRCVYEERKISLYSHLQNVVLTFQFSIKRNKLIPLIHVIHLHVALIHNVATSMVKVFVHVYQTIMAHRQTVNLNVSPILIVPEISHVSI